MGKPVHTVSAPSTVLPEFRATFIDAMEMANPMYSDVIDMIVDKVPMDSRLERYTYWKHEGNPSRWDEGRAIPTVGMSQEEYLLYVHQWGAKMIWSLWDARDSKSASILGEAKKLANKHLTLRPRIVAQILEGSVNPYLKDVVETAVDGDTLYSSSTRHGVTGGNIVSTSAISSMELAYTAVHGAFRKFQQFLSPDDINPLLSPEEYSEIIVLYHPSKFDYWNQLVTRKFMTQAVGDAGATVDNNLNPSASKYGKFYFSVVPIPFIYLTDEDDAYAFAANGKYKSIIEGGLQGLEEYEYSPANSERAGEHAYEAYQCFERFNMRAHFSQYTVKLNVA